MNYLLQKTPITPLHISHPIRVEGKDGTVYYFPDNDYANNMIEKYKIDVVDIRETQQMVKNSTTIKSRKTNTRTKIKV